MKTYIFLFVCLLSGTYIYAINNTENQIDEESEYFLGQIDILQMLKSFISNRVELISPDHPLVQKNER